MKLEGKLRGFEWTTEGHIIAALVVRLGGSVDLTEAELREAEGLELATKSTVGLAETIHIEAG